MNRISSWNLQHSISMSFVSGVVLAVLVGCHSNRPAVEVVESESSAAVGASARAPDASPPIASSASSGSLSSGTQQATSTSAVVGGDGGTTADKSQVHALRAAGAACSRGSECASGVCEGRGCGPDQAHCARRKRSCTRDLRPYCGCDGSTFRTSGSCPGRPFRHRGSCESVSDSP